MGSLNLENMEDRTCRNGVQSRRNEYLIVYQENPLPYESLHNVKDNPGCKSSLSVILSASKPQVELLEQTVVEQPTTKKSTALTV